MSNKQTIKVETPNKSPVIRRRNDDTLYFEEAQLSEFLSTFYEYLENTILPRWITVLWGVCAPVFGFFLSIVITCTQYNHILFFTPSQVKDFVRFACEFSGAGSLICLIAGIIHFARGHRHLSRKDAVTWGIENARNYCNVTTPKNPEGLSINENPLESSQQNGQ